MIKPDRRQVLEQNPQIQEKRVAEYLEYARKMKEQGVDLDPRYQVAPPLGRVGTAGQALKSAARSTKR